MNNQDDNRDQGNSGSQLQKQMWRRMMLFVLFWAVISSLFFHSGEQRNVVDVPYTTFKAEVMEGKVAEVRVKGQEVSGTYDGTVTKTLTRMGGEERVEVRFFKTVLPSFNDPELMPLLENNGVVVKVRKDEQGWLTTLVISLLPWVLIIGFFIYMNRKMRDQLGGGSGMFGFGKSKAKRIKGEEVHVSFEDVAGLTNAKKELQEMVEYLRNPERFRRVGAELPRGILLAGPPGTGKTLMARAMAGEAGVPFFSISGSEFIEMFVGVGASRVRDLFNEAKKAAPSLIFIDELDSIGRARGTGVGGGHDEREQTLNQILSEIDGFTPHESVIVIGATNRPDVLDPALIRPGRFDRQVTLDMPQRKARVEILKVHGRKLPLAGDVDFDLLAGATVGFAGADLKNLVNEAALLAASKQQDQVTMDDFNESRDKIIMGVKREDRLSEEERIKVAYHESGHVLTALLLPGTDPVSKVTIIPRGRSLGATEQVPVEDRHNIGREYLLNRLAVITGGRVAEELVFGDITSGAGDDLKKATEIARRMVCQWGMSDKVGLVVFRKGETHPFLGRELAEERDYSEATAEKIDEEVRRILDECRRRSYELLQANRQKLDLLAEELRERETLTINEIKKLLSLEERSENNPEKKS